MAERFIVSRAFVKENNDWEFCFKIQDTCCFAKEDGSCPLQKCIQEKPDQEKPEDSGKKQ
jgi:hypothetical protein